MKKQVFLTLASALAFFGLQAQMFYTPAVSTKAYSQLTNGVKLNAIPGFPNTYWYNPQQAWTFYGEQTDDDTLLIGNGGFIITTGPQFSMAFDPFLAELTPKTGGNSGVYYEYDQSSTPKRLSFEWRDMLLEGNPGTDFVNFKVNLYSDQVVEFHYGSSVVSNDSAFRGQQGPQVIYTLLSRDFTVAYEFHSLTGDPASPTFFTSPSSDALNDVPANGTVYRFEPFNLSEGGKEMSSFEIYPNPVQDFINVKGSPTGKLEAYNLSGVLLNTFEIEEGRADVSDLKSGVYLLRFTGNDQSNNSCIKIVKE